MGGISGNINAIRDWTKNYYYDKSDIADFFSKISLGLIGYKLTIIGDPNSEFTIVEDAQTNPQTYNDVFDSDGVCVGVYFFHEGSTITISDEAGSYNEHELDSYEDTVYLRPLVIATPVMTDNNTPNTVGTCSASSEMWYDNYHYIAAEAFKQTINDARPWQTSGRSGTGSWIKYSFNDPVIIKRCKVWCIGWGMDNYSKNNTYWGGRQIRVFTLQASNDNSNWVDLWTCERIIPNNQLPNDSDKQLHPVRPDISPIELIKNSTAYKYYRIYVNKCWDDEAAISRIDLYKLDDIQNNP